MINVACPCLQPAQYRPVTAYCIKLGKSGTRRSPVDASGRPRTVCRRPRVLGRWQSAPVVGFGTKRPVILPNLAVSPNKAAPRGAAGPASAVGSALAARPPHAGPHGGGARRSRSLTRHAAWRDNGLPPSLRGVQFAGTASMAALRAVDICYSPPDFQRMPAVHAPDADFAAKPRVHCVEILVLAESRTNRPTPTRTGREGPQQTWRCSSPVEPFLSHTRGIVVDGSGGHEACVLVPHGHPKLVRLLCQADHQFPQLTITRPVRCGVDEVTPGLGPNGALSAGLPPCRRSW